jgi:hypothetical protein
MFRSFLKKTAEKTRNHRNTGVHLALEHSQEPTCLLFRLGLGAMDLLLALRSRDRRISRPILAAVIEIWGQSGSSVAQPCCGCATRYLFH